MKKLNSFIMSRVRLVNFLLTILYLTLFDIFFVLKVPVEDLMKKSLAESYYRFINYNIYHTDSTQVLGLFVFTTYGLLTNVLLVIYLVFISLFNKRNIIFLSILVYSCILLILYYFIGAIINQLFFYVVISTLLFIVIVGILSFNKMIKCKKI